MDEGKPMMVGEIGPMLFSLWDAEEAEQNRAAQWAAVADARDKAERRAQLARTDDGWSERLAQRHRFSREANPDDGQTSRGHFAALVIAGGLTLLSLAVIARGLTQGMFP